MRKIILVFLAFQLSVYSQNQIGLDIQGGIGDRLGSSVSISKDGSVIAVGAYSNDDNGQDSGHVKIFQNNAGSWTQIGNNINGEATNDFSGVSVSLSDDGNTVAIGGSGNDGNRGYVRVFQNNAGSWTQIGDNIIGDAPGDAFGDRISLSSDGNVVAITAFGNDTNGSNSGHVKVYKNMGGNWIQSGNNFEGSMANSILRSVSLSTDGSILAYGSSNQQGRVSVYKEVNDVWSQVGNDIIGVTGTISEGVGNSISLNGDGNILAVGAFGTISNKGVVLIYENTGNTWSLVDSIEGENNGDFSGTSIELSEDGNIIAIGARSNSDNGTDAGHVRIFENDNGNWSQIGEDIDGETTGNFFGEKIALSGDGSTIISGARLNSDNGIESGHARIYDLSPLLSTDEFDLLASEVNFFPNPATRILTVLSNTLKFDKIEVISAIGQEIMQIKNLESGHIEHINVSEINQGIYFLRLTTDKGIAVKQFVKK